MNAILHIAAFVLTLAGAAAIWHGDTGDATLLVVLAIACRQGTTPEPRDGR